MRKLMLPIFLFALVGSTFAGAADVAQTIDLKDGGKIIIEKNGTMAHLDAAGKRVIMREDVVMEAKDGSKVMMKNNQIWKTISTHGTLKPGH